jgi:hypothetical protein
MSDTAAIARADRALFDPVGSTGEIFGHEMANLKAVEVRHHPFHLITVGYKDVHSGKLALVLRIFEDCDVEYLQGWPG